MNERKSQKMIKVVLDTNVLVSSLLSSGSPAAIVDFIAEGKIIPVYNDLILQEYWDVLSRKKFDFHSSQVTRLINDIVRTGIAVESETYGNFKMTDEDDRKFYEAAKKAPAYLVTGNVKHFPSEPFIVTPAHFLTIHEVRK